MVYAYKYVQERKRLFGKEEWEVTEISDDNIDF